MTSRRSFLRLLGLAPVAAPFAAKAAFDAAAVEPLVINAPSTIGTLGLDLAWKPIKVELGRWKPISDELFFRSMGLKPLSRFDREERQFMNGLDTLSKTVDTFSAFDKIAAHATDKLVAAVENVVDTVISETAFCETPALPKPDSEVES